MRNSADTRQKILSSCVQLFATKGYAGTSMNDIISKIGISKGSVYWHFKSKEDIFVKMITENYAEWINLVNSQLEHVQDPIEKLRKYGELFIATVDMPVWRISPETYWNEFSEENQRILDECFSLDDQIILEIFQEAIEKDLLRDTDSQQLTWTYLSCLEGMFEKIILSYKKEDGLMEKYESFAKNAIELFISAITK